MCVAYIYTENENDLDGIVAYLYFHFEMHRLKYQINSRKGYPKKDLKVGISSLRSQVWVTY